MRRRAALAIPLSTVLFASLLASSPASADDDAVDIVGPSARSSIEITDDFLNYRNLSDFSASGLPGGSEHQTVNTLAVSGIYALSNRVNLTAALPWYYDSENNFTWQGDTRTTNQNGIGDDFGISAILLDNTGPGFKLVGALGVDHVPSYDAAYHVSLQPQYRFDDNLLVTTSFGAQHEANYPNAEYASVNLIWRATPTLSIVPSLGTTRYHAYQSWSSYSENAEELSATYHINRDWSVSAEVTHATQSTKTSSVYVNDFTDGHTYNYEIGVRRFF